MEDAAFPGIEKVADEALRGVPHTLSRYSACEDKGVPGATSIAAVGSWIRPTQAREHLRANGWTAPSKSPTEFVSPDGQHTAKVVRATDSDGVTRIEIYFSSTS